MTYCINTGMAPCSSYNDDQSYASKLVEKLLHSYDTNAVKQHLKV